MGFLHVKYVKFPALRADLFLQLYTVKNALHGPLWGFTVNYMAHEQFYSALSKGAVASARHASTPCTRRACFVEIVFLHIHLCGISVSGGLQGPLWMKSYSD